MRPRPLSPALFELRMAGPLDYPPGLTPCCDRDAPFVLSYALFIGVTPRSLPFSHRSRFGLPLEPRTLPCIAAYSSPPPMRRSKVRKCLENPGRFS